MYLDSLELENFKIFKQQIFNFKKITLLTGTNSSGKSTVLNAIVSALQTKSPGIFPIKLDNYGDMTQLGGFKEIVNGGNGTRKFSIKLTYKSKEDELILKGKYRYSSSGNHILPDEIFIDSQNTIFELKWNGTKDGYKVKKQIKNNDELSKLHTLMTKMSKLLNEEKVDKVDEKKLNDMFNKMTTSTEWTKIKAKKSLEIIDELEQDMSYQNFFHGLAARLNIIKKHTAYIGPIRAYPSRHYESDHSYARVDAQGSNAYNFVIDWKLHAIKKYNKLISDMQTLKLVNNIDTSSIRDDLVQINIQPHGHNESVNVTDVGFGISQILPILVANIELPDASTMLINQPEVHLHPSGQADLGNYFVENLPKRSFIIETHSEYLINRLRLLVAKGILKEEDINIIYIDNEEKEPIVHEVSINKYGSLVNAPKSFFETYFLDNSEMLMAGLNE